MPLEPAFLDDAPYGPDGLLIDELVTCDRDAGRVVCRAPTHPEMPLTVTQRVHPERHPRHVNGGVMVHLTAMAGWVHGYYCLDLRHADGWIGYGARARDIRFKNLAPVGEPIEIECTATQVRRREKQIFARYTFLMTQAGTVVYESDQTAMFIRIA